ncbi:alpha-D-ribose 1-methylphosphonate 5-phosphate C-P-lyase PhnJ [bacterium]|nr:alpha-D-ribose 1-methylphosphonate 5-phosphate C-P-lyase PhnJ [bacterium]
MTGKEWIMNQQNNKQTFLYNFAYLDENTKKEIRRKILKAVAIPGYQVPFASREMPIGRGWGTGGLQLTLSIIGCADTLKVIDQGSDDSVNAISIKKFIQKVCSIPITNDTKKATVIQTRHRIPEEKLEKNQILVFQVPVPEILRIIEPSDQVTKRMHAEADYSAIWLYLYEDIIHFNEISIGAGYPVMVNQRYIMDPSPIPRFDIPKLNHSRSLLLFGAGREKRIYAIPPFTDVHPLEFEDFTFRTEDFSGKTCSKCNASDVYLDEIIDDESGTRSYQCSDTSYCEKRCQP